MTAEKLLPHRPPMLLVDTLCSYAEGSGEIEAAPGPDCILAGKGGALDETALVELMAQGYAAVKGYHDLVSGMPVQEGFLVGIRRLRISGRARVGERLTVKISTVGSFEGFAVVEGTVLRGDETIAAGTLKLWLVNNGTTGEMP